MVFSKSEMELNKYYRKYLDVGHNFKTILQMKNLSCC